MDNSTPEDIRLLQNMVEEEKTRPLDSRHYKIIKSNDFEE